MSLLGLLQEYECLLGSYITKKFHLSMDDNSPKLH